METGVSSLGIFLLGVMDKEFLKTKELWFVLEKTLEVVNSEPEVMTRDRNCVQVSCFAASLLTNLGVEAQPIEATVTLMILGDPTRYGIGGEQCRREEGWSGHMVVWVPGKEMILDLTLGFQPDPLKGALDRMRELEGRQNDVAPFFPGKYDPTVSNTAFRIVGNGAGRLTWNFPGVENWRAIVNLPLDKIEELVSEAFVQYRA